MHTSDKECFFPTLNLNKHNEELMNTFCIFKKMSRICFSASVTARKYVSVIAAIIHFPFCFCSKIPQKLSVSKVA